ncbi:PREDICTED: uncharacterized protein LOC109215219 [Nicotiana attenuata]|uniref:uncharacterized protein LOC109215219 n=1 Tax=Nicotiana attenuata TaxID=49451 RepID=UPI000904B08E|nr:PREDICTED: uncharacterized protein LOC109215219 [Nicotiana attenuata]
MWSSLRNREKQIKGAWLMMGDFNAVVGVDDRMNGREVQDHETKDFRELLEDYSLTELPTVGKSYTWTNSHVFSRIDRAIVNDQWITSMPPVQAHVMESLFSDHSPICIEIEDYCDNKKRPFKFYNCMVDHPEFEKIIKENWYSQGRKMAALWQNLKNVKEALKRFNRTEYMNITGKIKASREQLKDIQRKMNHADIPGSLFEEERKILAQLEKWSMIEESIYKQKSRVQWLKEGDTNSAYFFATMKGRKMQNQITKLMDNKGCVLTKPKCIEEEITGFYKQLLGTAAQSIPAIHPGWIKNGPVLSREQQMQLVRPFTKEEVLQALKGIADMKAPGGDGFNSYFFKKYGILLVMK